VHPFDQPLLAGAEDLDRTLLTKHRAIERTLLGHGASAMLFLQAVRQQDLRAVRAEAHRRYAEILAGELHDQLGEFGVIEVDVDRDQDPRLHADRRDQAVPQITIVEPVQEPSGRDVLLPGHLFAEASPPFGVAYARDLADAVRRQFGVRAELRPSRDDRQDVRLKRCIDIVSEGHGSFPQ
jgi:hypothetical protein